MIKSQRLRPLHQPGEEAGGEPGGDDLPQVFSGSIVTRGGGIALTSATGQRSRIGRIGQSLATLERENPRLQAETSRIEAFCASGGHALIGRVPYHPDVTRAMVQKQTLPEYGGPLAEVVANLWDAVNNLAGKAPRPL